MSFSFDKYLSEITAKSIASELPSRDTVHTMDNLHSLAQGSPKRDVSIGEENVAAAIARSREDKSYEFNLDPTTKLRMNDLSLESTSMKNGESKMSEAEYVFKALSGVPPDMRYKMIPSLVKNLMLKPYGDVRVSGCFSTPIMSVRCQPESRSVPPASDIENAAAQVLEAKYQDSQPNTNIEGLVSTVLSLTQAFRNIEEISTNPNAKSDGGNATGSITPDITDAISKQLDQITPQKESEVGDDKPKVWREGMDLHNKEDTSKTVFMSQDLNKRYDEKDAKNMRTSFDCAASKISREISYFTKIMEKAGADMKSTEYSLDPIRVLDARQKIKTNLTQLKSRIEEFITVTLEGDISDRPVEKKVRQAAEIENVEYVYPPDKKGTSKDQKIELSDAKNQTHICSDCKEEIIVENGNLEESLQKHTHGEDAATGTTATPAAAEKKAEKKDAKQNETKLKRLLFVNKLVPCLMDDNLFSCVPCGVILESDQSTLLEHMESNVHVQNLNKDNQRVQNDMILQNPDIFGPGKLINLTHFHIVMNKIFVDPMSKYAYCGLCRKELPPKQRNIDEHIESKSHNKVLLESLEGNELSVGNSNTKPQPANSYSNVKTANMLDVATNPSIDVLELEKLLENKIRNRSDSETVRPDIYFKTDTHAFSVAEKKYVCLYCDAYMDKNEIESHNQSPFHGSNVAISKYMRNGITPLEQTLLRQNAIAVTFGVTSNFKCLVCTFNCTNKDVMLKNHINVSTHIQMLNGPPKSRERNVNKNTFTRTPRVVLHKNGTEFWCHKCFVTIANVSLAFQHVAYPGHEPTVDGVAPTGGMMFYCNYCSVKINGEKNVAQHVAGPKHRTANSDRHKADNSNAEALKSQLPKTSRKNLADEKSKNQAQVNKQKKTKETENQAGKNTEEEESALLRKNGVIRQPNGKFECMFCKSGPKLRSEIFLHIFSFEHITLMAKRPTS